MARPNRKSQEFWFDTFADFSVEDQAAALKILEQVHRLAVREAKRNGQPATETTELLKLEESNGN